jgi:hypothetical protein
MIRGRVRWDKQIGGRIVGWIDGWIKLDNKGAVLFV